jgi:glutathione S-transferase
MKHLLYKYSSLVGIYNYSIDLVYMRSVLTKSRLINLNQIFSSSKFSTNARPLTSKMTTPNITLYTQGTPNGQKASVTLEVLDIPYTTRALDLYKNEQKEDWYLKINPNGRIPAIVDHSNGDFAVFESGAIMLYLAQNYDPNHKLWPKDPKLQSQVVQWLMFQMGGVGPMMGQAEHFIRSAPEKIEYAINRYTNETKRLFSVIESQLTGRDYLVGDQLTIADIAHYTWASNAHHMNISLSEFPNLEKWADRISKNPGVIKGLKVPSG